MLEAISTAILFAAFAADCFLLSLHFVHMLQLNSYQNDRYRRWMKENRGQIIYRMGWLLLATVAVAAYPTHRLEGQDCLRHHLLYTRLPQPAEKSEKTAGIHRESKAPLRHLFHSHRGCGRGGLFFRNVQNKSRRAVFVGFPHRHCGARGKHNQPPD